MATYTITMPDVGEGIAEAELVELNVAVGDSVLEDDVIGSVMTDKATVEIPSVVMGKITWIAGEVGDTLAVGAAFVHVEVIADRGVGAGADNAIDNAITNEVATRDVTGSVETGSEEIGLRKMDLRKSDLD